ncbi:MAG: PIN domain-containing protein [Anaerolineae bacterium]|nr:PIN domain-containing protein [Anaerolineae bacterium]
MLPAIFLDTSYLLALVSSHDASHDRALEGARGLAASRRKSVTTEAVLFELCNGLSRKPWRQSAVDIVRALRTNADVVVVPNSSTLLTRSFELFANRLDKEWSLTDCLSFIVMQDQGLKQVLTTDHHFRQAGFEIVL